MTQSNRIYYHELSLDHANIIKHDLYLFNSMVHDAYDKLYKMKFCDLHIDNLQQYLKTKYGTNDYFPLSAVSQAKGILSSNIEVHQHHVKDINKRIKHVDHKIKETEKKLKQYLDMKESMIELDKTRIKGIQCRSKFKNFKGSSVVWHKETPYEFIYKGKLYSLYLFEVQIVDVEIKHLKHSIKMLAYGKLRLQEKLASLHNRMPSACFGSRKLMKAQYTKEEYINDHETWKKEFDTKRNHTMNITGRRQGKYCNNLFKYHVDEDLLYYYSTSGEVIKLPIRFHLHSELLKEKIALPHNTPGKAVYYSLEDHGEYCIIKAVMELPVDIKEFCFFKNNGVIGLDINVDHLALSETDQHGNLVGTWKIPMRLKHKTQNQRKHMIRNAVKEVFTHCEEAYKPLIIEHLDFKEKKEQLKYGNKRRNQMISEFAYAHITEAIYARSYKTKVGVKEVNPAYTSQIGRIKYMQKKGISIHTTAAYLIARRGQGFKERVPNIYKFFIQEEKHHWSKWSTISKRFSKIKNKDMLYNPVMKLIELEGIRA